MPVIIPTPVTPLCTASKQALILGIMPSVIVSFLIISKISDEEIYSTSFFSLLRTPLTFVIKSNRLDLSDLAIAPAAVSPFILYV